MEKKTEWLWSRFSFNLSLSFSLSSFGIPRYTIVRWIYVLIVIQVQLLTSVRYYKHVFRNQSVSCEINKSHAIRETTGNTGYIGIRKILMNITYFRTVYSLPLK